MAYRAMSSQDVMTTQCRQSGMLCSNGQWYVDLVYYMRR